jgi:hypothetical protein
MTVTLSNNAWLWCSLIFASGSPSGSVCSAFVPQFLSGQSIHTAGGSALRGGPIWLLFSGGRKHSVLIFVCGCLCNSESSFAPFFVVIFHRSKWGVSRLRRCMLDDKIDLFHRVVGKVPNEGN